MAIAEISTDRDEIYSSITPIQIQCTYTYIQIFKLAVVEALADDTSGLQLINRTESYSGRIDDRIKKADHTKGISFFVLSRYRI